MTALTWETQHEIADAVARAWLARGVPYPYDDLYQDAIEICHEAASTYRPGKATLNAYLYSACARGLSKRVTRALQPVGTRSNGEVKNLRTLRTVEVCDAHVGEDPTELDTVVYRAQVRSRLVAISEDVPEGKLALAILMGLTTVADQAGTDRTRTQRLYYCVRRMKQALQADSTLARMAREASA